MTDAELIARLLDTFPGSLMPEAADRIEALIAERDYLKHDIERHIQIAADLATENEALRKDAKRHRIARDHARLGPHGEWVTILGDPHSVEKQKEHYDNDLDAAMEDAKCR